MALFLDVIKPEVQEYIRSESTQEAFLHSVVKNPFPEIPFSVLMNQIKGIIKSKNKLPFLAENDKIIFPEGISLEQCSSELTAYFKASLIPQIERGADLTAGFGIDSMAFATRSKQWDYFEINEDLAEVVTHNMKVLGHENVNFFPTNGIEYVIKAGEKYDFIYLDPARRDKNANRVFSIEDCTPNIIDYQDELLKLSPMLMTKLSPMLDISLSVKKMKNVSEVYVVGVRGEVKEIVLVQKRNINTKIGDINTKERIFSVDLTHRNTHFIYESSLQNDVSIETSAPLSYIYDTTATMKKSGVSDEYAFSLGLKKLNANTLLFTSNECISEFCGRVFKVIGQVDKKNIRDFLPSLKANIICRNYPLTPSALQKKWKINDGGDAFIIAFKDNENKYCTYYAEKVIFS